MMKSGKSSGGKSCGYKSGGSAKMSEKQQAKVGTVMSEYKKGSLHSGKSDKVVKNPKQAVAIAMSEARRVGKKQLPYSRSCGIIPA